MLARVLILFYAGLRFEERDLIAQFGTTYQRYRRRVRMLLPRILGYRQVGASR